MWFAPHLLQRAKSNIDLAERLVAVLRDLDPTRSTQESAATESDFWFVAVQGQTFLVQGLYFNPLCHDLA
jgi:hypothetical protein